MFKRKRDVHKVDSFGPFLRPIYPQKTQNIAKNQKFFHKLHPYDYQINKDQEVRDHVSTTFTETPNSGVNVGENILL